MTTATVNAPRMMVLGYSQKASGALDSTGIDAWSGKMSTDNNQNTPNNAPVKAGDATSGSGEALLAAVDAVPPNASAAQEADSVERMARLTTLNTLGTRINWACETDPLRRANLRIAADIGIPNSSLQRMRNPSYENPRHWDVVYKLAETLGVSREWIRYGEGEARPGSQPQGNDRTAAKNTVQDDGGYMNSLSGPLPAAAIDHESFAIIFNAVVQGFKDAGLPIEQNISAIASHAWNSAHELSDIVQALGADRAAQLTRASTAKLLRGETPVK